MVRNGPGPWSCGVPHYVQVGLLIVACGHPLAGQSRRPPSAGPIPRAGTVALASEIHWQDAPLRDALARLSQSQGVPILLDRRVDPETLVSASLRRPQLAETLRAIAEPYDCDVVCLPSLLYVGPRESTQSLATWHAVQLEAVRRLPADARRRWEQTVDASWPRLTEPRPLVVSWLQQAGVHGRETERIPHDLWPGQQLPPLDLLQRLVIVLAGFQLAPQIDPDGSVQIVELPKRLTVTRSFRIPRQRQNELARLRAEMRDAEWSQRDASLQVTGRIEDLERVASWLNEPTPSRPPSTDDWKRKRFTLTVKNQTIDAILSAVTRQLDLDLTWHPDTTLVRQHRVSLEVKDLTRDELLAVVLKDQGVRYRVDGKRLTILPTTD